MISIKSGLYIVQHFKIFLTVHMYVFFLNRSKNHLVLVHCIPVQNSIITALTFGLIRGERHLFSFFSKLIVCKWFKSFGSWSRNNKWPAETVTRNKLHWVVHGQNSMRREFLQSMRLSRGLGQGLPFNRREKRRLRCLGEVFEQYSRESLG